MSVLITRLRCAVDWPKTLALFLLASALPTAAAEPKGGDVVVLFPGYGQRSVDDVNWEITLHGWVFEPERRTVTLAVLRKSLGIADTDMTPGATATFNARARAFLQDDERGKRIAVHVGDRTFMSEQSQADGHFVARLQFPVAELAAAAVGLGSGDRLIEVTADSGGGAPQASAPIFLLAPTGLSVISDIDDTIKITEVTNRRALLRNTFLKPFEPVPGMALAYQAWATNCGAKFHYVSASPWQLYPPLAEFARASEFPPGTFHLKEFRWKDRSFFSLFASPVSYKLGVIGPLLKQFPGRQFVLVGDSGEKDPEIYGRLARKYPRQTARILIRDLSGKGAESARYQTAFQEVPRNVWQVFRDPAEIVNAVKPENWTGTATPER